ncbi:MAG: BolA/IbaG family iron-sulfur metabolism protein [Gammaproteobacteria bacterium]|jgi:BolA protein|nr:BolA/IbaG family iron-sulfur metabolism protein [Gammaproteobacteria bacterium]
MSMQTTIEQKLSDEFAVDYLQVENESHLHSVAPGAESHFKVTIVSNAFDEQMLIKRHRKVNQVLQQEMKQIHALALHTLTPQEWQARNGQVAASPACRGGGKNQ